MTSTHFDASIPRRDASTPRRATMTRCVMMPSTSTARARVRIIRGDASRDNHGKMMMIKTTSLTTTRASATDDADASSSTSRSTSSSTTSAPALTPPQRSMIERIIALRTRLNERVAKSNQFAKFVEKTLLERDEDLKSARRALVNASNEMETLREMVVEAKRGANAEETRRALDAVAARLERARTALRRDASITDEKCLREVPVSFQGNASDVRLMGSFDDWTRGAHLSPEWSGHGDGMTDTFTAVLSLAPGTYEVKFLVDGEWRTTDDWPCVGDGFERNMLLEVR